jgi:hypothetical protein
MRVCHGGRCESSIVLCCFCIVLVCWLFAFAQGRSVNCEGRDVCFYNYFLFVTTFLPSFWFLPSICYLEHMAGWSAISWLGMSHLVGTTRISHANGDSSVISRWAESWYTTVQY